MQDKITKKSEQGQALVIGAGIAGLLAARVLADYYSQVLIIERDTLPTQSQPRAGAPQSHHLHRLLPRGKMILESLFSNFIEGLLAHGAFSLENTKSLMIGNDANAAFGLPNPPVKDAACSRALLEWEIRQRVQEIPGVRFMTGQEVIGLIPSSDRTRITGIQIRERGQLTTQTTIMADLIVDASGRSSKLIQWLQEYGYQLPETEQVHSEIGYSTRHYQLPIDAKNEWSMAIKSTDHGEGVALSRIENNICTVIIGSVGGNYPPTDVAEFEQRLATHLGPHFSSLLPGAQPLDNPRGYRVPTCVRHHFEQMEDWPAGLLVMGDALCNFDPIHGQGMSVAAIEAETLARCLYEQQSNPQPAFERRVLQRMQEAIAPAWWLSSVADLSVAGVTYTGPAPLKGVQLIQQYFNLYLKYALLQDMEQLQKGDFMQTYFAKYTMMTGLLISPREVINAQMLITILTAGEDSAEQKLLAGLFQSSPQHFEAMLDEIIPDFSLSFENLQAFATPKEISAS